MFKSTWKSILKLLIIIGFVDKPKCEGKWFDVVIKANPGINISKMDKNWQSVFKNTEYCSRKSKFFKSTMEGNIDIKGLDGVLFYKFKKMCDKKDSGFEILSSYNSTQYVLDSEQKELRLKVAREEEKQALEKGDSQLAAEKKLEIESLQRELEDCLLYRWTTLKRML